MGTFTSFLSEISLDDLRHVGGEGANLGHLIEAGFPVPPGFCVLARAYESFLSDTGLEQCIGEMIEAMDFADLEAVDIEDTGGKTIEITGDVLTVAPLKLEAHGHKTLINEALTEYHFEGKTGYGIAEYLHQLDN